MKFASLFAVAAAADNLSGTYEGSVPFIIDVTGVFDGSAKADVDVNVKVASVRFNCKGEDIAETDAGISFPNIGNTGDCLGDGIRTDGKDPTKYLMNKNGDGTLTFKSDGYPDLKMKKNSLAAAANLDGTYEGSVPFIIDVTGVFDGSAKADVDVNVKVASVRFNCKGEDIAETDAGISFPNIGNTGDCLGDGIRTDGKDPTKYLMNKNGDGTLTFKSDGYPDLKMKKKSLAAAALDGHYEGSVPFIIDVQSTFNGDSTADVLVDVKVAGVKIDCKGEAITETDSLVTFPNSAQDGDCLGDGIRSDSKDPSKYTIKNNGDGSLTFTSDGYPDLKMTKSAIMV